MKKILLAFSLVCINLFVQAQTIDFGVKAGLNRSELSSNLTTITNTNSATGIVAGAFGRAGILGFFVQPEVLFSQRKGAFQSGANGTAITQTLSYIDVPILVGYKFLFFRANAGPSFQNLIVANRRTDGDPVNADPNFAKDKFNSSVIGYQAGIGLDLLKLTFDIRYDGSFSDLGKKVVDSQGNTLDYSTRATMWQFTMGFKIL